MKSIAFLFPGQGAQYPGMGKDFFDTFKVARHTFEEANDLLSFDLSKIVFEGPESRLIETRFSQTAIFVTSVAMLRALQDQMPDIKPSVCAGLSLGEYTALFASGRLGFADTLSLVNMRGLLLNEACEKTKGAMSAILGLTATEVDEVVRSLHLQVWVANFNCPGQSVISGTGEAVLAAAEALKQRGAKRVIPLQVHGAFHSPLMQSAQDQLAPAIAESPIIESTIEFVMNVPGDYVSDIKHIKDNMTRQVTHSVRWEQSVSAMMKRDIALYLEIGCGKTLSGLNKKMGMTVPTRSINQISDLDMLAKEIACV